MGAIRPSERSAGLEDENLMRAARLCIRGTKVHPMKPKAYWSLGLILRCRGTPPPKEDEASEENSGSSRKKRRKKKRKQRRNKARGNATKEAPAELRNRGLQMLLKAVQLESHAPVAAHLLKIAQILACEAEEQKQLELTPRLQRQKLPQIS